MSLDFYSNENDENDCSYRLFKWVMILCFLALVIGFPWFIYKDLSTPLPICKCECKDIKTS